VTATNNIEIAVRINARFDCRCWSDHHDPSAGLPCTPLLKTRHKEFFQVFETDCRGNSPEDEVFLETRKHFFVQPPARRHW